MNNSKILIINPFGIGDVTFSTPLLEAIKKRFSESSIGFICNKRAYEIIKLNPHLDKIFIYEKDDYRLVWNRSKIECLRKLSDFLKSIKKERFDIAIDLSLGYVYSLFLMMIGIKRRLGFNYRRRGRFLTDKIDIDGFNDKHVIEYYLDMLKLLDIDPTPYRTAPKIYLADKPFTWVNDFLKEHEVGEGDLIVGVIPGCGASWGKDASFRRWDMKKFASVCDSIIERYNAKVILFGDAKETVICDSIQNKMRYKAISACGRTSIEGFLALIKRCKFVITNDGGPLHMAVGLGIKTISIFGPVDEKIYGPYPLDSGCHIVVSKNDISCRPCYRKFKYKRCERRECLNTIEPEDVLRAVDTILLSGDTAS